MTTITLLHGIGGASWSPVLPALMPSPVLDWALPGYGGTPLLAETSFSAWAEALRIRLDRDSIPRIDLIGHSTGGMLAQDFALRFPERVRALVLYATTPAFGGRDPSFAEAFLRDRLSPLDAGQDMAALARASMPPMLRPGTPEERVREAIEAMAEVPEPAYRATVRCLTTFNRRDEIARIAVPTLIIGGEQDPLAPPKTLEHMRDTISDARLVVLPGCGHFAHLEDPPGFNAAVQDFLRALREG